MAESEPKPKLIELVAPGAGQGWKAVLRNGKPAVVHEIPIPAAEAAAAAPRLQRLYEHRHPALSPVLGWGTDPNGLWIAVEPNEGTPLGTILSRGPLTPPAAAALGAAVLSGVAALHEDGIAMGGFNAAAVRVTGNGEARLAGHPAAAVRGAPSQSDLRADVRSCGMAVCAAFGVDPAGAPAPPNIAPGLVVTMRSMASGAMGPAADRAQGALREMASALLAPDRQMAAQSELATRAGGREVPAVAPFLPGQQAAAQTAATATPQPPGPPAFAPAPYVPTLRDETPVRAPASYEAPERPLQTYGGLPAIPVPAPAPPPPAPSAARPSPPAVPTWDEAPPRTPAPYEAPPAASTAPPAPAPPAGPPAVPPPAFETFPSAPVRDTSPPAPAREAFPPPPAPFEPAPPRPPFDSPAPAAEPKAPAVPAWTPVAAPAWQPGEAVSSGPADAFVPAAAAAAAATPAAASAPTTPTAPPTPAAPSLSPPPVRRPLAPRRPAQGGLLSERPTWLVPAAVAVVVILILGIVGLILVSHRPGSGGGVASTSPSAKTSPKTSPKASPTSNGSPLAVPTYAPASADPITKVIICSTATPCNISGSPAET